MKIEPVFALIAVVLLVALGMLIGYWLWHHEPQIAQETFKPGHVQADGSIVLTRIPTAPADTGPPAHLIPKGAMETARVKLKVKPKPLQNEPQNIPGNIPACECKAIDLDLSLIHGKDGTGVIASADGAEIDVSSSTYTPMLDPSPPQYRHFAFLTNEPGRDGYTAGIGKRFLGNRFGVSLGGSKQPGQEARPLVGFEFNW